MSGTSIRFWLGLSVVLVTFGKDCCPNCDELCPWNGACDNGRSESCKDKISGPYECQDRTTCSSYADCSDDQAARRVGYICDGFPYFNGGYPMENFPWGVQQESYNCLKHSTNGNYCQQWSSVEDSVAKFDLGTSTCQTESSNGQYCQTWHYVQTRYKKCFTYTYQQYNQQSNSYETVTETSCCAKTTPSSAFGGCCHTLCAPSSYNAYTPSYTFGDCTCRTPSANGLYCARWHCEEYDTVSDPNREYEDYKCLEETDAAGISYTLPISDSGLQGDYCSAWTGASESVQTFQLSTCACTNGVVNGTVSTKTMCGSWNCSEKGTAYHWPNHLWILLPGLLGGVPFFIIMYLTSSLRVDCLQQGQFWRKVWGYAVPVLFLLVFVGGLTVISVWKAGLSAVFFMYIPLTGIMLLTFLYESCRVGKGNGATPVVVGWEPPLEESDHIHPEVKVLPKSVDAAETAAYTSSSVTYVAPAATAVRALDDESATYPMSSQSSFPGGYRSGAVQMVSVSTMEM